MNITDNIVLALVNLKANKMRSLLTMLGIVIGIASIIAIMTVGDSLTGTVSNSLNSFGINNITVSLTQKDSEDTNSRTNTRMFNPYSPSDEDLITDEMINEYKNAYGEYINAIVFSTNVGSTTAIIDDNQSSLNIIGVNPDYQISEETVIKSGRFINDNDLTSKRKVCVISDYAADELYGTTNNIIGKAITLTTNNVSNTYYIVGVYEYDEDEIISLDNSTTTTSLLIPYSTANKLTNGSSGYQSFTVSVLNDVDITNFVNATTSFFASYYTHNKSYTVEASSLQSLVETVTEALSSITIAISLIAAISLLVGGIGVMNILLVSITERTREIGTRKALGATEGTIKLQFIIESVTICIIGGVIGIILGLLIGKVGGIILGYEVYPNINTYIYAVLFSMTIGVFFGYYPASKAARLDPIEALRYE